ncbi:hypothetical protein Desac_0303 [Desulfobacca acetoxidans DSM 11109]|uniref:Uncharacterized protein n=1 Tax=Desulfobacca acetoxidans (strain ATCC 700848 / DSM 11109 / ASRB2) TaxID=880072 RepID=F2NEK4_DESAR|nr:hypothetical protein Desac_0303 [Desulfobacca acetoxidans DSM 11109]
MAQYSRMGMEIGFFVIYLQVKNILVKYTLLLR